MLPGDMKAAECLQRHSSQNHSSALPLEPEVPALPEEPEPAEISSQPQSEPELSLPSQGEDRDSQQV